MDIVVRMTATGGPERLAVIEHSPETPGATEVRIRHHAIGVNFIDIYQRQGLYPLPLPAVLGVEGAGIVEAVGEAVDGLSIGDRIVYAGATGGYATTRLLPAWRAIRLPDAISTKVAAASMLRGLTAHMLLTRIHAVGPETVLLVHAAAGGLGSVLTRWASRIGATVIATVGSAEKAELARRNGAAHVIVGRDADIVGAVAELTDRRGVDYAIDGIGGDVLLRTLACVRRFGTVASVGQAAGAIPPIDVEAIGPVRSLSLSRPSVMGYAADPHVYRAAADEVLLAIADGIRCDVGGEYPLGEAGRAHADLEAGITSGSMILVP